MKCPKCKFKRLVICIPMFYELGDGCIGLAVSGPTLKPHLDVHCTNCDWVGKYANLAKERT